MSIAARVDFADEVHRFRTMALAGRLADALRAFQAYRSLLVEEFATGPSPEVVRTERRVATGWNGVVAVRERATPVAIALTLHPPRPSGFA